MKYRVEVDGLRALSILPVVIYHAGLDWVPSGFLGVDVFFVISGYLITTLVLTEVAEEKFSLLEFYERRARRILPALFLVVLLCIVPAYAFMHPDQFALFGGSVLSVALFSSNFYFYKHVDYFHPDSDQYPLLHTWSLGVEEQFYVLLPVLVIALYASKGRRLLFVMSALLVLSFLIAQMGGNVRLESSLFESPWKFTDPPSWNFYLLPSRAHELLFGCLAAALQRFGYRRSRSAS